MPAAIRLKTRYTGYLRRHASGVTTPAPALPFGDDPYLPVTAGGGGDGEPIVDWVLRAYEAHRQLPYPALMGTRPVTPRGAQGRKSSGGGKRVAVGVETGVS